MQILTGNMQALTRAAIKDLQNAFQVCNTYPADGLILSALVKIQSVQDLMPGIEDSGDVSSFRRVRRDCRAGNCAKRVTTKKAALS